jgi:hypothetical protein
MFVCCECCLLSGRGLCDELITRPEESYRLWCVVVCYLENLVNDEALTRAGSQRHKKNEPLMVTDHVFMSGLGVRFLRRTATYLAAAGVVVVVQKP